MNLGKWIDGRISDWSTCGHGVGMSGFLLVRQVSGNGNTMNHCEDRCCFVYSQERKDNISNISQSP